ncbi:MAG: AMP-binding protein [Streptosporangiales bacterium]|nr:AMP-binding protein [Streptosporangiales bacterium]
MKENFGTVLETIADVLPDQPVLVQGDRVRTWAELDARASRLAGYLAAGGVRAGSRVGIGQYNGIEYVESIFAAFKLSAVPVNVNYRYREEELRYLLDDAQAEALLFDTALTERVAGVQGDLPRLRCLVRVGGSGDAADPPGTVDFETAVRASEPLPRQRRGDDHWLLYTGGTTGAPKGVLTLHSWLFNVCVPHGIGLLEELAPDSLAELAELTRKRNPDDRVVCLPAAPLIHGTGIYTTLGTLLGGGTVVFATYRSYDPVELIRLVERHRVTDLVIVGDIFARPLADALDRAAAEGEPADLSALRRIASVGATWSGQVKEHLVRHGDLVCKDVVAASEGGPFAISLTQRGENAVTSRFVLAPGARVLDESGRDVEPGSGQVGVLAAPTNDDVRYLGDEAKTAETFRMVDGRRYVIPGDMATVEADGSLIFKGRGSRVINSGGEKVFAEEVEQVIGTHPSVLDSMVVGIADELWGQRIVAMVAPAPGASLTESEIQEFVGSRLAGYKRPRRVIIVPEVRRSPAGKPDLGWAHGVAEEARTE